MDNKISAAGLAAMLALATGKQKQLCESFVTELFALVGEELTRGENVRIKGFGTFKLVEVEPRKSVNILTGEPNEIPGHTKIVFVMAKELASLVNAPFEAFEAVEIADGIATEALDGFQEILDGGNFDPLFGETSEDRSEEDLEEVPEDEPEEKHEQTPIDNPEEKHEKEVEEVYFEKEIPIGFGIIPPDDEVADNNKEVESSSESDGVVVNENRSFWKKYQFIWGIAVGVLATVLIGFVCLFNSDWLRQQKSEGSASDGDNTEIGITADAERVVEKENALTDTGAVIEQENTGIEDPAASDAVPTQPSDTPVYDTVTQTHYLTTIAQEHYGNFNLWPIIYDENAAILGHPDRIVPGTRVVVPPLSKYNIDPNNKEQIEMMKQRGKEIYSKYK